MVTWTHIPVCRSWHTVPNSRSRDFVVDHTSLPLAFSPISVAYRLVNISPPRRILWPKIRDEKASLAGELAHKEN